MVAGEMFAGVLLGPSILGRMLPSVSAVLFPPNGLGALSLVSEAGLVIFMFVTGLRVDFREVIKLKRTVAATSVASILAPFCMGAGLAFVLGPPIALLEVPKIVFAMFLGVAMSITAFPVLSRILIEQNLDRTRVGRTALACASLDDVVAWTLLAVLIAMVQKQSTIWIVPHTLLLLAAFLFVIIATRGWISTALSLGARFGRVPLVVVIFGSIVAASAATDWIGLHPFFGAFALGVAFPRGHKGALRVVDSVGRVNGFIFVPAYFAVTGLRLQIPVPRETWFWASLAIVLAIAVTGKFGGAFASAWASGEFSLRESTAIAILLNTRGLVELIVLNVGLDAGIISRPFFTAMVLMALGTTVMAMPLVTIVYGKERVAQIRAAQQGA